MRGAHIWIGITDASSRVLWCTKPVGDLLPADIVGTSLLCDWLLPFNHARHRDAWSNLMIDHVPLRTRTGSKTGQIWDVWGWRITGCGEGTVLLVAIQVEAEFTRLSKKELEVLDLLAHGMTSRDIARILVMSQSTVESHRTNMRRKTGFNLHELVVSAIQLHLFDPER